MQSLKRLRPVLAIYAALALGACREEVGVVATPLPATADAYYPYALAPAAEALPYAAPAPIGQVVSYDDGYAWAERAYAVDTTFYDVPPDYGFNYYDTQPWVWETEDDWILYAEPLAVGYRYYYYAPEAAYPYFVRDPDYGYGYDDYGRLVVLYDGSGVLLPTTYLYERADIAGRYRARAYHLHDAARRERRRKVGHEAWLSREPYFRSSRDEWFDAARNKPEWVSYRTRYEGRELRRFDGERVRRGREVEQFQRRGDVRRWEASHRNDAAERRDFDRDGVWRDGERARRGDRALESRDVDRRGEFARDRNGDRREAGRDREWRRGGGPDRREVREERRGREGQLTYANLERRDGNAFERRRAERREGERGWREAGQGRERQAWGEGERRREARQEGRRQERERRWREEGQARERQARAEGERRRGAQQEARRQERERGWREEGQVRERQAWGEGERRREARQEGRRQERERGWREAGQAREHQARAEGERQRGAQQEARRQEREQGWREAGQAREHQARSEGERRRGGQQEARRQEREQGGGEARAQRRDGGDQRRAEREARREARGNGRGREG